MNDNFSKEFQQELLTKELRSTCKDIKEIKSDIADMRKDINTIKHCIIFFTVSTAVSLVIWLIMSLINMM